MDDNGGRLTLESHVVAVSIGHCLMLQKGKNSIANGEAVPRENSENHNRITLDSKNNTVFSVNKMTISGSKRSIFRDQGGRAHA
ncbi:MAG: hypothetical protein JZU65_19245 [Chlorobium sp.]|nr:hypothetical protein [Chlorobium sp.]